MIRRCLLLQVRNRHVWKCAVHGLRMQRGSLDGASESRIWAKGHDHLGVFGGCDYVGGYTDSARCKCHLCVFVLAGCVLNLMGECIHTHMRAVSKEVSVLCNSDHILLWHVGYGAYPYFLLQIHIKKLVFFNSVPFCDNFAALALHRIFFHPGKPETSYREEKIWRSEGDNSKDANILKNRWKEYRVLTRDYHLIIKRLKSSDLRFL